MTSLIVAFSPCASTRSAFFFLCRTLVSEVSKIRTLVNAEDSVMRTCTPSQRELTHLSTCNT